jgi:hypothetical protein
MRHCPDCHADQVIKNGSNATGKPKYACKACGRQFVDDPAWRVISDEIKGIIDRLLHERISLAGSAPPRRASSPRFLASSPRQIHAGATHHSQAKA